MLPLKDTNEFLSGSGTKIVNDQITRQAKQMEGEPNLPCQEP